MNPERRQIIPLRDLYRYLEQFQKMRRFGQVVLDFKDGDLTLVTVNESHKKLSTGNDPVTDTLNNNHHPLGENNEFKK